MKPPGTAALGLGRTSRRDTWWLAPGVQAVVFTVCATYLFVSGILLWPLFRTAYEVDGYLSPFFSPLIVPAWLPTWISPGLLILWIPLGFRATCYYYRKAYYRVLLRRPARLRGRRADGPQALQRWRRRSRSSSRTSTATSCTSRSIPLFFLWVDAVPSSSRRAVGDPDRAGRGRPALNAALLSGYSFVVPLAAPPRRRQARLLLVLAAAPGAPHALAAAHGAQPPPHGVGLGEPAHGHVRRRLRPARSRSGSSRPGDPF